MRKQSVSMLFVGLCCLHSLALGESKDTRLYDLRPLINPNGVVLETVSKELMVIELSNESGPLTHEVTEATTTRKREHLTPWDGVDEAFVEKLTRMVSRKKMVRGDEVIRDTATAEDVLLNRKLKYTKAGDAWEVSVVNEEKGATPIEGKVLAKLAQQQLFTDRVYYPDSPVAIGAEWNVGVEAIMAVIGSLPVEVKRVRLKGYLREVEERNHDKIARIEIVGTALGSFDTGEEGVSWATTIVLTGDIRLSLTYGYEEISLIEASLTVRPEEGSDAPTLKAQALNESHTTRLSSSEVEF